MCSPKVGSHRRSLRSVERRRQFSASAAQREKKDVTKEDLVKGWDEKYNWSKELDVDISEFEKRRKEDIEAAYKESLSPHNLVRLSRLPTSIRSSKGIVLLKGYKVHKSQSHDEKVVREFFEESGFKVGEILFLVDGMGTQLGHVIVDLKDESAASDAIKKLDKKVLFSHSVMWKMFEFTKNANVAMKERREKVLSKPNRISFESFQPSSPSQSSASSSSLFSDERKPSQFSSLELKNSELPEVIKKLESVMVQRKQKLAELRKADEGDRTHDTQAIDRALDDLEGELKIAARARTNALERVANTKDGRLFFNAVVIAVTDSIRGERELDELSQQLARAVTQALKNARSNPILSRALEDIFALEEFMPTLKYMQKRWGDSAAALPADISTRSDSSRLFAQTPNSARDVDETPTFDLKAEVSKIKSKFTRGFIDQLVRHVIEASTIETEISKLRQQQSDIANAAKPTSGERSQLTKLQNEDRKIRKLLVAAWERLQPEIRVVDVDELEEKWRVSLEPVSPGEASEIQWHIEPKYPEWEQRLLEYEATTPS